MDRLAKNLIIGLSLLLVSSLASQAEKIEEVKELSFGIIATESRSNLKKWFDPLLRQLEKNLNIPTKSFFAQDYAGIIEAMRFGKVHVAWFGNKSGMEAVDRAHGGRVLVRVHHGELRDVRRLRAEPAVLGLVAAVFALISPVVLVVAGVRWTRLNSQ